MLWRNKLTVNISRSCFGRAGLSRGETFKIESRYDLRFTLKTIALSQLTAYRC